MIQSAGVNIADKQKKDRLYELDYMRFIACLAVMVVHITANGVTDYIQGSFPHIVTLIINRSFKFTTPVFAFLSGVTSFFSYKKRKFEYFPYLKKRLGRVLVPYFVWCLIYYAIYIKLGLYVFNIADFTEKVLWGKMSYHLYFVIMITQMYIVGPVFYKILKESDKKELILIASGVITALCARYMTFENSDRIFLKYMVFYMLGIYVTMEHDRFISWTERNKVLIVVGYIASSLAYAATTYYGLPIYIYSWFIFSVFSVLFVYRMGLIMCKMLKSIYSFIKLFGQASYYIYLMHPLILTMAILYTNSHGILSVTKRLLIYFVTVIPITVISCLIFTAVKNKIKKHKKAALAAGKN
jgi:surface polysaccharide O-acyltransferase-like enzyme